MKRDGIQIWKRFSEVILGRRSWCEFDKNSSTNCFWISLEEKTLKTEFGKICLRSKTDCKENILKRELFGPLKKNSPKDWKTSHFSPE